MTIQQTKPWLSFEHQLQKLANRNMTISDVDKAKDYLSRIGYYRLSGYWYPFRKFSENGNGRQNKFHNGTDFKHIVQLYVFDKKLRLLSLDAIERIEMAIRTDIAYTLGKRDPHAHEKMGHLHGNFTKRPAYSSSNRRYSGRSKHHLWLDKYDGLVGRAIKQDFVKHNLKKYGYLPIWVAIEILDFGSMSRLYTGLKHEDALAIAQKYGCSDKKMFESWLRSFNHIRNISAHHTRLWNANIVDRAIILTDSAEWQMLAKNNQKPYVYFCLMQYMLKKISPNSTWGIKLFDLLKEFPKTPQGTVTLADFGYVKQEGWELWE